jgi:hypothetical protein
VQDKKRTPGKLLNFLSFPVRLINEKVKNSDPDPEAANFTRRYLDLADKALHTNSEEPAKAAPSPINSRSHRLRLEPYDGSPAKDYRVHAGEIEVRLVATRGQDEAGWRRLSPEELSQHVRNNTIVAQWLQERLGWRKVLQKCSLAPDKKIPPAA